MDRPVIDLDCRLLVSLCHFQEVPTAPEIMCFPSLELPWGFPILSGKTIHLLPDPADPRDRIGSCDIQSCRVRRNERYTPVRRMNGQVNVFNVFPRDADRDIAELNVFGHQ